MTPQQLRHELKAMIAGLLEIDDFPDQAHFMRDLRADSLLIEELVAMVEKKYRVSIPNDQLKQIKCLDDAVLLVGRLRSPRG
jgi:acyl carrier protein